MTYLISQFLKIMVMVLLIFIRHRLRDAYDKDIWEAGRKAVSAIWDALGWIWHGNSDVFHKSLSDLMSQ